ncbi:MAG: hypothetical protein M3Z26_08155 [Bacteroidota bacterium]|nr:hypothetical protein [Bacteroidota bacterium]
MIDKVYQGLINELESSTSKKLIQWDKGEGQFAYYFTSNNRKFLVDKYYSFFSNQTNVCFSLTIFDSNKILDELVSCKVDGLDSEFELLKNLYEIVEKAVVEKRNEKLSPILNDITESLKSLHS